MCLGVFIASNHPLPLVEWDEEQPRFNVVPLSGDEWRVKIQSQYPHVVYAGSHQRCGCGFIKDGEVGEELNAIQRNYDALAEYLRPLQSDGAALEIFSCWEGQQEDEPEHQQKLTLEQLVAPDFEFEEKAYYEIA